MRILYLNFKMRYINKTRFYFEKVIESLNGEFYGPGHTPKKTIELGIASFVKDNGPFDIILCDEYITQDFSNENSPKFKDLDTSIKNILTCSFSSSNTLTCGEL